MPQPCLYALVCVARARVRRVTFKFVTARERKGSMRWLLPRIRSRGEQKDAEHILARRGGQVLSERHRKRCRMCCLRCHRRFSVVGGGVIRRNACGRTRVGARLGSARIVSICFLYFFGHGLCAERRVDWSVSVMPLCVSPRDLDRQSTSHRGSYG